MGMILTGRHVSAREGLELGFVNQVVAPGEALKAAEPWADQICQNSPMSIRASKQAVMRGLNVALPEAMVAQREYPAVRDMIQSADYVEGPKAFAEKRPPRWQGK
jgi:crotonobetainyl-CoA hydratase